LTDPAAKPPENVEPFPSKPPTETPPSVWKRLLKHLPGLSVRLGIFAIAATVAVLFALRWDAWVGVGIAQTTDDAYVRADITPLSAKVEGYIRNVAVGDFQRVKAGDLLVQIEDDDYKARVAQAEAAVAGAEAGIDNLKSHKAQQRSEITRAESNVVATLADVERTQLEEARQRDLVASTYGTRQRL
jgi:membrane fusion protein, multidrug efflux system